MILVKYEYPSANGNAVTHTYECGTLEQADRVCKEIEAKKESGYKIIDVTNDPLSRSDFEAYMAIGWQRN